MSAMIIAFPSSRTRNVAACDLGANIPQVGMPISATALADKFNDHFLPVVQASMDLLEADEQDFEARCRGMLDVDGTAMIDELCEELSTVARQMRLLVDGLDLTGTRLRTAMVRLVHSAPLQPETAS